LSEELKANKEVVMTTVKTFGAALLYASDELKKDKELVFAACQQTDPPYELEQVADFWKEAKQFERAERALETLN